MLSFPMGKLAFSHSGNRGQKTFALSTQMHHFSIFGPNIIDFCFELAIGFDVNPGAQNVEFSNGEMCFFAFRKSRSENVCPVDSNASPFRLLVRKPLVFALN